MAPETITSHAPDANGAEARYFRRLIEKQPAVLMRVALDGAILAANDAAMGLLGVEDPNQLAGLVFPACLPPEHRHGWNEFTAAIAEGTSKSFECLFTNLVGTCRQIVFHGVPLLDHHDALPSVILGAHDMSAFRRSEEAFEKKSFAGSVVTEHEAPNDGRLEQLERLLRDGRHHLLQLRTKLDHEHAEAQSLAVALAERDAALQQSIAAQDALAHALAASEQKCATLEAAISDDPRASAEEAREHAERYERSQDQCNDLTAERDRLAELLVTRERELKAFAEKEETLEGQLRNTLGEQMRLEHLLTEHAGHMAGLQSEFDAVLCERNELSAHLAEAVSRRQECEAALAHTRAELDALNLGTEQLLPLVSVGRLALEISEQLRGVIETINIRLESVITGAPLESSVGHNVQLVRADLLVADLLSRELLLSCDRSDSRVTPEPQ